MNPVVQFEMPYEDKERVARFYSEAFGWKLDQLGEDKANYVVAQTTENDEYNVAKEPGHINGGFYAKSADMAYPSVVIATPDIQAGIEKIEAAGGTVLGEQMDIPGMGKYVSFLDTEGNRVSLLQPAVLAE
jgi:uncharacterized protein